MRCYLPLTSTELTAATPPQRDGLTLNPDPAEGAADEELRAAEEIDQAAVAALVLARENGDYPTRLVACGSPERGGKFDSWDQVDCFYVDGDRGREIAALLVAASTQQQADDLMEELFDQPLEWYEITERLTLARELHA